MDIKIQISQRLIKAREDAGLSQTDVADNLGIVRQTYARFEQGESSPDITQIITLSHVFDKPLGYFYDCDENTFRFAMRADSPDLLDSKLRNNLIEKLKNLHSIEEAAGLSQAEEMPGSMPLFTANEADLLRVEDKARSERNRLGIGSATCVGDIVSILETADIRVIPFQKDPKENQKLDGFSAFNEKYGTAIFVNSHPSICTERQIFSICHEYGHLIFHRDEYDGPDQNYRTRGRGASPEEKIANHFAACFLIPADALRRQFAMTGGGWAYEETIMRLKRIFRVSAVCMIDRLAKTRLINQQNARVLWATAQKKGWKVCEPQPSPERLAYDGRLLALARKAWELDAASESFIGELLELDRKALSQLIKQWYNEKGVSNDAL
ncbi:XRE family transcriptional regulator [Enterobacter cloacae]|uniref:helix-turn-helix domain-containing protein n=1 Tax=Enterobacter cloacae complex TaxID=354276 RepID=UPI001EDC9BB1|nr:MULTISPECIES: XRE family transcriptional regulator [Enterobacter cloacae complex]MCG3101493.1 XRE family transcriptional regulator [Enterobacter sp. DRP3]MCQ4447092.1 XRE family transcriptional regulator [Enterobacter cloacae]MDW2867875.1 XRE family transcriptional regulator [Enterobacter hormaechei]